MNVDLDSALAMDNATFRESVPKMDNPRLNLLFLLSGLIRLQKADATVRNNASGWTNDDLLEFVATTLESARQDRGGPPAPAAAPAAPAPTPPPAVVEAPPLTTMAAPAEAAAPAQRQSKKRAASTPAAPVDAPAAAAPLPTVVTATLPAETLTLLSQMAANAAVAANQSQLAVQAAQKVLGDTTEMKKDIEELKKAPIEQLLAEMRLQTHAMSILAMLLGMDPAEFMATARKQAGL